MRLLFDHNLSPQLVSRLRDLYSDAQHVYLLGMAQSDDQTIWEYAIQNNLMIVTRDSDYNDLSLVRGFPPKVIWIRRGNCSTIEIERILRSAKVEIEKFTQALVIGVMVLH